VDRKNPSLRFASKAPFFVLFSDVAFFLYLYLFTSTSDLYGDVSLRGGVSVGRCSRVWHMQNVGSNRCIIALGSRLSGPPLKVGSQWDIPNLDPMNFAFKVSMEEEKGKRVHSFSTLSVSTCIILGHHALLSSSYPATKSFVLWHWRFIYYFPSFYAFFFFSWIF